jgi:hypothetical protein
VQQVRRAVLEQLLVHPRIRFQGIAQRDKVVALAQSLPEFPSFRGQQVAGVATICDWDHKLPSQEPLLRIMVCYSKQSVGRLFTTITERAQRIELADRFPEFDVPDFDGIVADEMYLCTLRPDLTLVSAKLVSDWRRDVTHGDSQRALAAVLKSEQLLAAKPQYPQRTANLDDLEVAGWVAPCESGLPSWCVDVWWLTELAGQVGKGISFLVDVSEAGREQVALQRQFSLRLR